MGCCWPLQSHFVIQLECISKEQFALSQLQLFILQWGNLSTLFSFIPSDYEQDWRNRKSNHVGIMAFLLSFKLLFFFACRFSLLCYRYKQRSPSSSTHPSVCLLSTLCESWENRFTRRVPTSAGFYFLPTCGLWPTDSWCSAHGFLSISGSFPSVCLY